MYGSTGQPGAPWFLASVLVAPLQYLGTLVEVNYRCEDQAQTKTVLLERNRIHTVMSDIGHHYNFGNELPFSGLLDEYVLQKSQFQGR